MIVHCAFAQATNTGLLRTGCFHLCGFQLGNKLLEPYMYVSWGWAAPKLPGAQGNSGAEMAAAESFGARVTAGVSLARKHFLP